MALVREWGDGLEGSASDPQTITIPATIPAGHTLIAVIVAVQYSEGAPTITDSKGNVWTVDRYEASGGSTTRHIVAHAKITNELTDSDTIIVDIASSTTRFAWCVTEWDSLLNVDSITFDDPGTTASVQTTDIACPDNSMLVTGVLLRNPGRVPTVVPPTQMTATYASLASSGNRVVWQQYREVPTASTVTTASTLDVGGGVSLVSLVLVEDSVEPPVEALGSVIVGGTKVPVVSRSVIVGGVKKPVTSVSVIIGGVKKSIV